MKITNNDSSGESKNEWSRRELTSMGLVAGSAILGPVSGYASANKSPQPNMNFSLEGKSAIVTGAARGIGRAIAVGLASAGANIMGIDIANVASPEVIYQPATKQDLEETGRQVQAKQKRFIPVVADIRDISALRKAADRG